MLAVEMTTATLTAWMAAAVLVGFALGWLLRPWAMADRIDREQTEIIERESGRRADAEAELGTVRSELTATAADLTATRSEVLQLREDLDATRTSLAGTEARLEEAEAKLAAATAPRP